MTSVRLRLLILALLPLIFLMPLLLLLGMTRWNSDYDKVLIANVESDLRIAEQYLEQLMNGTGRDLSSVANSTEMANLLNRSVTAQVSYFRTKRHMGTSIFDCFRGNGIAGSARSAAATFS